jgi:hypothetical protein
MRRLEPVSIASAPGQGARAQEFLHARHAIAHPEGSLRIGIRRWDPNTHESRPETHRGHPRGRLGSDPHGTAAPATSPPPTRRIPIPAGDARDERRRAIAGAHHLAELCRWHPGHPACRAGPADLDPVVGLAGGQRGRHGPGPSTELQWQCHGARGAGQHPTRTRLPPGGGGRPWLLRGTAGSLGRLHSHCRYAGAPRCRGRAAIRLRQVGGAAGDQGLLQRHARRDRLACRDAIDIGPGRADACRRRGAARQDQGAVAAGTGL